MIAGVMVLGAAAAAAQDVAQELATPEEAEGLFGDAMAYVEANGLEAAFAAFNDPEGLFVDRDLYVFCLDYDGQWYAMGANPNLVGRTAMNLEDREGRRLVPGMIEVAETGERGIYEYSWPNPLTNQIVTKSSFIQKVGDNFFCGMGYYAQGD
jgi:cytochrome c